MFPATIDWLAVSAVGEWAVKRLCAGGAGVLPRQTFSNRQSMRPCTGALEHSRLSGGWEEVHTESGGVLIARGCWRPHCFGAGSEGLYPCGVHTRLRRATISH